MEQNLYRMVYNHHGWLLFLVCITVVAILGFVSLMRQSTVSLNAKAAKLTQPSLAGRTMIINRYGNIAVLCTLLAGCGEHNIKPFTSDGCSAFPDGTFTQNELWLQCCTAHDLSYWQGGTYGQRLNADQELQQCVAAVGQQRIADLMLAGVRVGGTPFLPTSFRWGYGWPFPRGYRELSDSETTMIDEQRK